MVLNIDAAGVYDFRAHVVASGQYQIAQSDEFRPMCRAPMKSYSETASCGRPGYAGRDHTRHQDGSVGVVLGNDLTPRPLASFAAYDPATATSVTGDSVHLFVSLEIPFVLPEPTRIGVAEYRSFAPIGINAVSPPKPPVPTDPYAKPAESFVALNTSTTLQLARIEKLTFVSDPPVGPWQLQWASPTPERTDQLVWTADSKGLGPVSYQTVNPFTQNTLSQRGFLAGVAISLASAAILLIVEQYLAHRRIRTPGRSRSRQTRDAARETQQFGTLDD